MITAFCLYTNVSFSQDTSWVKKLMHRYLSNEKDTVRKNSFFPFPVGSIAPETGLEYGFTAIYSFYTDKLDKETRVSTLNFLGTHTTKNQTSLKLLADVWSKQNKYHYYAEFRYQNYPYDFYGIGAHTVAADKDVVNEKRGLAIVAVDKKIVRHYYIGLRSGFEKYAYHNMDAGGTLASGDYYGKYGGKQVYFGIEQIYDSRNNVTYTTNGLYGKVSFNYTPDFFGGNNFHGSFINFDGRYFTPVSSKITLAFNGIYREISGKDVPFYLLPKLGGEDMMRGYYQGRFRDKNMLAAQAEFRYRFIPRFAAVAFGGYGTVYGQENFSFGILKPSYGIGIRYFFDLSKDLTMRLDYGVGQKLPNEKRLSGVYFSMNEAF
ncbi:hypothetical protein A9P82_08605 [Arachidicoccus ginsenosidimutans]|nr:hypothetical protein A9P82_08605 [Arachidicoccus sp. BS20]